MVKTDFLKARPLLPSITYYGVILGFWLYTFAWVMAFVALFRYSEQIHWLILAAFAVILFLGVPSLRDLVRSYDVYKQEWEEFNRARDSENVLPDHE